MTTQQPKPGFFRIGKHWPFVIAAMLLAHASLMLGTIAYVSSKNDTYVETDYYAQAVEWDDQRARLETADDMGWSIEIDESDDANPRVTLTGPDGRPLDGALVEFECVHPAHAQTRAAAVLLGTGNGTYTTSEITLTTPGFWKAEISIRHSGAHAIVRREFEIN